MTSRGTKSALDSKFDAFSDSKSAGNFVQKGTGRFGLDASPPAGMKSTVSTAWKVDYKTKLQQDLIASDEEQIFKSPQMVDTFTLKIFCVLFCRGTPKEKSSILFDAILGPMGIKLERD